MRRNTTSLSSRPAMLVLTLVLAVLLAACAPATPVSTPVPTVPPATATPEGITLTDGLGRQVTLAQAAQRILSLAPSNTEIVFAIGAGAQLVGRDELSDYPAEAAQVASIGSTFGALNTEAIVALRPDLILAAGITPPEQVKALSDLGLTVFLLPNPATFDDLYKNLETVGRLTGQERGAGILAGALETRVRAVQDKLAGVSAQPKVFYEVDATDPVKPWTIGAGTFVDTLITMAGGRNVGAALGEQYGQISSEELVRQDPDLIVLGDSAFGVTPESVGLRPGWEDISAVKNGAVHVFDDNLASRPGPRLVDGLEQLAKLVHPDAFK